MGDFNELVEEIRQDHESGAAELAARACHIFSLLAGQEAQDWDTWRESVVEASRDLVRAQPSMAPMLNLANDALWAMDGADSLGQGQERLCQIVNACQERGAEALDAIVDHLDGLLGPGARVLTHSRSSTVEDALLDLYQRQRRFSVVCTESRPLYEGRTLAKALAQAGIPVTLVVDAAVYCLLDKIDLILVGADSISSAGLVNKIGTSGLALKAQRDRLPVYVCCSSAKLLPQGYDQALQIQRQTATEVWETAPHGVTPLNFYFDITPLSDLTGVVTESGILEGEALFERLASRKLHPLLRPSDKGMR